MRIKINIDHKALDKARYDLHTKLGGAMHALKSALDTPGIVTVKVIEAIECINNIYAEYGAAESAAITIDGGPVEDNGEIRTNPEATLTPPGVYLDL